MQNTIRFISLLCFLLLSMMCMAKNTAAPFRVVRDSITYELDPNTRTAKLVDGKKSGCRVVVPNVIKERRRKYKVNEIGDSAFMANSLLKTLIVGDSVRRIGNYAFYYCGQLDSICFSEKTKIDIVCEHALSGCYKLKSISLPKDFSSIAFSDFQEELLYHYDYKGTYPDWFLNNFNYEFSELENIQIADSINFKLECLSDKEDVSYCYPHDYQFFLSLYYLKEPEDNEQDENINIIIIDSLNVSLSFDGRYPTLEKKWIGNINDTTQVFMIKMNYDIYLPITWPRDSYENFTDLYFIAVSAHSLKFICKHSYTYGRSHDTRIEGRSGEEYYSETKCKCVWNISDKMINGFYVLNVMDAYQKRYYEPHYDEKNGEIIPAPEYLKVERNESFTYQIRYEGTKFVKEEIQKTKR